MTTTEKERFDYLIEKGYTATEDGKVISSTGKSIGYKTDRGYIKFTSIINSKAYHFGHNRFIYYFFHREIPNQVDHVNQVKSDNRLENLRDLTHQQNQFNKTAKGYSWHKIGKKWTAQIRINKELIHLGYFNTEEEAHQAYLDAKKIHHIIKKPTQ